MKIAVLILAHKNFAQLRLLIDHLKTDFSVYVHINKSVKHSFINEQNVHFINERYIPYWGSSNTPKAMLALMRAAYENGCDYCMMISGQDLPLMTNSEIINVINQNPVNYVYHHPLPKASWDLKGGLERLTLVWPHQYEYKTVAGRTIGLGTKIIFGLARKFQSFSGLTRKIRFEPWGGSMWLNLTRDALSYIMKYIDNNPQYMQRFLYTRLSDEILFHTILLGTSFKDNNTIINDDMRYIDWQTGPQYPRIFLSDDFDRCIQSKKFFGRKFDEKTDADVINKILSALK